MSILPSYAYEQTHVVLIAHLGINYAQEPRGQDHSHQRGGEELFHQRYVLFIGMVRELERVCAVHS